MRPGLTSIGDLPNAQASGQAEDGAEREDHQGVGRVPAQQLERHREARDRSYKGRPPGDNAARTGAGTP